jgi:hypothetical protein
VWIVGGAGDSDGFFVAALAYPSCAFRFLTAFTFFAVATSAAFDAPSRAPIIGSEGPSLEYGGVAVTVVAFASFSDDDANISLMRFGLAIVVIWGV